MACLCRHSADLHHAESLSCMIDVCNCLAYVDTAELPPAKPRVTAAQCICGPEWRNPNCDSGEPSGEPEVIDVSGARGPSTIEALTSSTEGSEDLIDEGTEEDPTNIF